MSFLIVIFHLIVLIILGLFFYAFYYIIITYIQYRHLIKYLTKKNMQQDLNNLEIGYYNLNTRSLKYKAKRKKYLSEITNDIELNRLKNIVYERDTKQNEIIIMTIIYISIIGFIILPIIGLFIVLEQ